jgi:hypothetical protein
MYAICVFNTTKTLSSSLVGFYMYDDMIKILELILKLRTKF